MGNFAQYDPQKLLLVMSLKRRMNFYKHLEESVRRRLIQKKQSREYSLGINQKNQKKVRTKTENRIKRKTKLKMTNPEMSLNKRMIPPKRKEARMKGNWTKRKLGRKMQKKIKKIRIEKDVIRKRKVVGTRKKIIKREIKTGIRKSAVIEK